MAIETVETLLTALRRSQLLDPEQVDEVAQELGPHYQDPQALADYLVEIDWLTSYQQEMLFQEQWSALTLGDYQLLDRLGEGGVSEVFKAWDTRAGREVALKVLRSDLAVREEAARQFDRECQAVTRLNHPNIIKTLASHQIGELCFFAMEYVDGMDLDRLVKSAGCFSVDFACECIRQTAQGLQHAHQLGLVHRDVKPANLFLVNPPPVESDGPSWDADVVVKVIDWGTARLKSQLAEDAVPDDPEPDSEKGQLLGTADYLAPEQATDPSLVDIRADVYSLGCTLYYLLTGQPPFTGTSLMQKLIQHREKEPPSVLDVRSDVPPEVEAIIYRMLAKDPDQRFAVPILVAGALRPFSLARGSGARNGLAPSANGEKRPTYVSLSSPSPPTFTALSGRPSTLVDLQKIAHRRRDRRR